MDGEFEIRKMHDKCDSNFGTCPSSRFDDDLTRLFDQHRLSVLLFGFDFSHNFTKSSVNRPTVTLQNHVSSSSPFYSDCLCPKNPPAPFNQSYRHYQNGNVLERGSKQQQTVFLHPCKHRPHN